MELRASSTGTASIRPALTIAGQLVLLGWGVALCLYCQTPASPPSVGLQPEFKPGQRELHSSLLFAPLPVAQLSPEFRQPPCIGLFGSGSSGCRSVAPEVLSKKPVPLASEESWTRALAGLGVWDAHLSDSDQAQSSGPSATEPARSSNQNGASGNHNGSPGHIFWVIPAFNVNYGKRFKPLTPKEKFQEWAQGEYDPLGLGVGLFEAGTLERSSSGNFCGYGKGWGGYAQCFGSLELDATDSSFIGDFALPVLLHQDPRYFRLGQGSFGRRVFYAVSRVFITYNDSGHTVFAFSTLSGTVIAAGLSNFYYPSQDVGVSLTMSRIAIDLGNTATFNLAAEFWPDIQRKLHRIF